MSKPIFDELRGLYAKWRTRHFDHYTTAAKLVWNLASGFRKYIGAPEHYKDPDTKSLQWYIRPEKAYIDDYENISYRTPSNRLDVSCLSG